MKLLTESREHAIDRMKAATRERGGTAVPALRFHASAVVVYGTAVRVEPE
jgi:uncharacterized protein YbjQ (UPF0145 family)